MSDLYLSPPSARNQGPAVISSDKPAYRILDERGLFADLNGAPHLFPTGSVIYFFDEPNEEMEPLNDLAREAMKAYLTKLDNFAREVAEKNGKRFVSRAKNLDEALDNIRESSRKVSLVQGSDAGVPIMGGRKKGRASAQMVGEPEVADTTARAPARRVTIQAA